MSLGSQNDITKTWLNFENSSNLLHSCSRVYRKSRLAYIPNLQIFSFANFHPCLALSQKSVKLGLRGGKGGLAALKRKVWLHPVERKWSHLRILHGPWSRLAYTRAHACQDTTEPGVETRRAALRRLVALHYYDIRHAWPALTIKPLFHLADWRGPESICQNVWCRIHSHNAWFPFCFRGAAAFFFSTIRKLIEFANF